MPRNRTRRRADSTASNGNSSAVPPRSKAGCWTCRIRRKRCDEQQDEHGSCQACTRLNIECLGWGTRRPDWCRDKDKLGEYKLQLKRKLCSRAGTRPSANKLAGPSTSTSANAPGADYHDVARAPSGESPRSSSSSVIGDEEQETDDYTTTPFTPCSNLANDSPLFFSPVDSFNPLSPTGLPQSFQYPKPKPAPFNVVAPKLRSLLANSQVPSGYANIITQLVDLQLYKSRAFSPGAIEQEVAHRAQAIEAEMNRLSNAASFDDLFSKVLGFDLDPTSFLSTGFGMDTNQFGSPMTMWSPDLMSDGMSTFSGSSVPTSPAAPLLAMSSGSYAHSNLGDFLGFDTQVHQSLYEQSYAPAPGLPSFDMPAQATTNASAGLGALGLSSDFAFSDAQSYATPAINLFPPTRSSSLDMELLPAKSAVPSTTTTTSSQASDPYQIHHATCQLLLQAVLGNDSSSPSMSSFDPSSPYNFDINSSPLEDCMRRLIEKFTPIAQGPQGVSVEYLFSATLAGAMSTSTNRRLFFNAIVKGIEARRGLAIGSPILAEAWAL